MRSPRLATDAQSDELRNRLRRSRLAPELAGGWDLGVPAGWLAELLAAWADCDLSSVQRQVDGLDHRWMKIGGQALHVVCAEGLGERPLPLLLTNGWPSSFLEYLDLIPRLIAAPSASAGRVTAEYDCFSLVIPALPGFGFSGPPAGAAGAIGSRAVAGLWNRLMTEGLGHARYVASGSDLGAGITAWLGRDHPDAVTAVHLASPHLPAPAVVGNESEAAFAVHVRRWNAQEGAYAHTHSTKPATLGVGLLDSPAGLAAWIGEKFMAWSSADAPEARDRLLLATLTLYWSTATITTSMLPYWAFSRGENTLPVDDPSPVPTAVSIFGGEPVPLPQAPRSLGQRYFNVSHWAEHPTGGHFPAAAAPDLMAGALRHVFGVAPATSASTRHDGDG